MNGRVPDFFIAGHAKSGTTALYEMLREHPQIYMPALKEPQFFAPEMRAGHERQFAGLPQTLEQYAALFADAQPGQRAGEASPSYLRSPEAPGLIAEQRPDARIVALLREPASYLRSVHMQFVRAMIETEHDLGKALALEPARREGRKLPRNAYLPQALRYSEHVRYAEQVRRYRSTFSDGQVLILIYDDFQRDNQATVREVLRFLEVDDTIALAPVRANPSFAVRSQRLHRLTRAVHLGQGPGSRAVKSGVNTVFPRRLRESAFGPARRYVRRRVLFGETPAVDERLMLELRRRYEPEVRALSECLGRDLVALWGYDRLD
ncbi:MAG TPA: sulfotransferase [Solirubrobacteraceae bacterium]|nr:sulfotransferase [Solirubrobacteraceae bacterium]